MAIKTKLGLPRVNQTDKSQGNGVRSKGPPESQWWLDRRLTTDEDITHALQARHNGNRTGKVTFLLEVAVTWDPNVQYRECEKHQNVPMTAADPAGQFNGAKN